MRSWLMMSVAFAAMAGAALAAPNPRDSVAEIAKAIEDHYFDPAKAKRVADDLRADTGKGAFDALTDPDELAQVLDTRLQPIDGHFDVEWSPRSEAQPAEPATPTLDFQAELRRANWGFRRIDILHGNIGFIELTGFADFEAHKKDAEPRLAAEAALRSVSHADAIIIDLRNNGGGSPAMVGLLASAFVEPGLDVYNTFHGRDRRQTEAPAMPYDTPITKTPLFILVSGRTGSAAEAFAYTLQAAGRATIVGEASAGAANPGGPVQLPSGFSIFISLATPINAVTGTNWEGKGVVPKVAVTSAEAHDRAVILALEAILATGLKDPEAIEARWTLETLQAQPMTVAPDAYLGTYGAVVVSLDNGHLTARRDRRPPGTLVPLAADLFTVEGDPSRRVRFERGADGQVVALVQLFASGDQIRLKRG